jgi:hypothetical protein
VFKTLWTEPARATATSTTGTVSEVGHGQLSFTKFRRFVVLRERLHSCLCLLITTYGGQGATKSGVRAQDHAVIYAEGEQGDLIPEQLPGENLVKEPFSVILENPKEMIDPRSRIDFSRIYTVEHNIRVSKLGRIPFSQHQRLDSYFVESITGPQPFSHLPDPVSVPQKGFINQRSIQMKSKAEGSWIDLQAVIDYDATENWMKKSTARKMGLSEIKDSTMRKARLNGLPFSSSSKVTAVWRDVNILGLNYQTTTFFVVDLAPFNLLFGLKPKSTRMLFSPVAEPTHAPPQAPLTNETLGSGYQFRKYDWKGYFQVGRVFSMLWTEPFAGNDLSSPNVSVVLYNERVHSKIRRFVIVKEGDRSCTCLRITNYDGRGFQKQGINLGDHCLIYSGKPPKVVSGITRKPVKVNLAKGATRIPDSSMVHCGKVYTVETNVKTMAVGTLEPESKTLLLRYFKEVFFGPDENPQDRQEPSDINETYSKFNEMRLTSHAPPLEPDNDHTPARSNYQPEFDAFVSSTSPFSSRGVSEPQAAVPGEYHTFLPSPKSPFLPSPTSTFLPSPKSPSGSVISFTDDHPASTWSQIPSDPIAHRGGPASECQDNPWGNNPAFVQPEIYYGNLSPLEAHKFFYDEFSRGAQNIAQGWSSAPAGQLSVTAQPFSPTIASGTAEPSIPRQDLYDYGRIMEADSDFSAFLSQIPSNQVDWPKAQGGPIYPNPDEPSGEQLDETYYKSIKGKEKA